MPLIFSFLLLAGRPAARPPPPPPPPIFPVFSPGANQPRTLPPPLRSVASVPWSILQAPKPLLPTPTFPALFFPHTLTPSQLRLPPPRPAPPPAPPLKAAHTHAMSRSALAAPPPPPPRAHRLPLDGRPTNARTSGFSPHRLPTPFSPGKSAACTSFSLRPSPRKLPLSLLLSQPAAASRSPPRSASHLSCRHNIFCVCVQTRPSCLHRPRSFSVPSLPLPPPCLRVFFIVSPPHAGCPYSSNAPCGASVRRPRVTPGPSQSSAGARKKWEGRRLQQNVRREATVFCHVCLLLPPCRSIPAANTARPVSCRKHCGSHAAFKGHECTPIGEHVWLSCLLRSCLLACSGLACSVCPTGQSGPPFKPPRMLPAVRCCVPDQS